jgi:hypothetical protein
MDASKVVHLPRGLIFHPRKFFFNLNFAVLDVVNFCFTNWSSTSTAAQQLDLITLILIEDRIVLFTPNDLQVQRHGEFSATNLFSRQQDVGRRLRA